MKTDDSAVFNPLEPHLTPTHRLRAMCSARARFSSPVQRFTSLLTKPRVNFDRKSRQSFASFVIAIQLLCFAIFPCNSLAQKLQLTNPLNVDRPAEVVEVPLTQVMKNLRLTEAKLESLVATDAKTKKRIPSQLYSYRNGLDPDTLLLLVQLPARGSMNISFKVDPKAPVQQPLVFGREAVERKDDFAWENELVAYRVYGPALQATGEITSGIDVWSKRIPNSRDRQFLQARCRRSRDSQSGSFVSQRQWPGTRLISRWTFQRMWWNRRVV